MADACSVPDSPISRLTETRMAAIWCPDCGDQVSLAES